MKKVLLIVIDALSSRVVRPALDENRLPNLQSLRQAATLDADSIAIFPSITPAATSSLITGRYPTQHGISGAYWYLPNAKKVVYFGYDLWAILEKGLDAFLKEFLIELNEEHLQTATLFQRVEEAGLNAACLNYIIYHGNQPHCVEMPLPLNLLPGTSVEANVGGPSLLYFGYVIQTPISTGEVLSAPGGISNRFGFTDDTTAELLLQLIQKNALPDFTLAYFPENDMPSHEVSPAQALDHLTELDELLRQIFTEFGGISQMLAEVCVVLTGDHAQSDVVEAGEKVAIRLDQYLGVTGHLWVTSVQATNFL